MNTKCPNPSCGLLLTCEDQLAGQDVQCTACGQTFRAVAYMPESAAIGATIVAGPATPENITPPLPVAASCLNDPSALTTPLGRREAISQVIQGLVMAGFCLLLGWFVDILPGLDVKIGRGTIGLWIKAGIAVFLLLILLKVLKPLRVVTSYYIGLILRVSTIVGADSQVQSNVSAAGLYFVLILYLALIYNSVLPPVLQMIGSLVMLNLTLINLIRLAFAIAGIVLAIQMILTVRPLISRLTAKITDRAVALTAQVDSKPCPSCGARVELSAKFCSLCGKPT